MRKRVGRSTPPYKISGRASALAVRPVGCETNKKNFNNERKSNLTLMSNFDLVMDLDLVSNLTLMWYLEVV